MMREYKNILVHNMVNLGDVVFSTACLATLKQAYPDAKISIVVRPKIADALQNHPYIDEVIAYEYKSKSDRLSIFRFAKLLKSKNFDLSISLDRKPRMALATWIAGIPTRIGPNKVFTEAEWWRNLLNTQTIELPYELWMSQQYLIYQDIIARFARDKALNTNNKPFLAPAPEANSQNASRMLRYLGEGPYVALCVRAEFALKNWLPERWAELIQRMHNKYGCKMFVTGISKDREYAQQIIDLSGVDVANFCGQTEMLDLVALYEQSTMIVTTDLGAAHVAAARNKPIASIFCCSSASRTKPIADISEAAYVELECRPCAVHKCEHRSCINQLSVDMVMEKVDKVWNLIK